MRSRTGLLVWGTGSSRSNQSDSPCQVSARGSIRHVIFFASDVGEISQSIGVVAKGSSEYLVTHCQKCAILRQDIRVSKGVMNGRVELPALSHHPGVAVGRSLSLATVVRSGVRHRPYSPEIPHRTSVR